jgi:hypothetical protein
LVGRGLEAATQPRQVAEGSVGSDKVLLPTVEQSGRRGLEQYWKELEARGARDPRKALESFEQT